MKPTNRINLANFFIYNPEYGVKEGKEAEKVFYYYPNEEQVEIKVRKAGFCAGMVRFTQTFKPKKSCEFIHTEKTRMVIYEVEKNFWMVMGLTVPCFDKIYHQDQISDHIYMSVLKQIYNTYKLFHGTITESMKSIGMLKLKENLETYFNNYIENKLSVHDADIMNTFDGIQFMSLDRGMYLKIQCLLNYLEENVPLVNKTVVMHQDQVIWSGLEQEDIALIYNFLKELVNSNLSSLDRQNQSTTMARFLIDNQLQKKITENHTQGQTSSASGEKVDDTINYFEFDKVYLGKPLEKYYVIPYNLSKLTFFIFIQVKTDFKLSLLKQIDEILAPHMVAFLQEIVEQKLRRNLISQDEKEIRYIYFNRLNLAKKSTLSNTKETPKYIMNLIAQLAKDLEGCMPNGEIFVKSGKDYWIACKKSDLREVYVIVCQKNANLILIDEEVKQLCTTHFSNIFFME